MRLLVLAALLLPSTSFATDYRDDPAIGRGLAQAFGAGSEIIGSDLMPNDPDPAKATEAIGILYTVIEGAAGNFNIDAGLFRRSGQGYTLIGPVEIFGTDPRDPQFLPDHITVTTTTLKDTDARCCPTGTTVWSIDRRTLRVTR